MVPLQRCRLTSDHTLLSLSSSCSGCCADITTLLLACLRWWPELIDVWSTVSRHNPFGFSPRDPARSYRTPPHPQSLCDGPDYSFVFPGRIKMKFSGQSLCPYLPDSWKYGVCGRGPGWPRSLGKYGETHKRNHPVLYLPLCAAQPYSSPLGARFLGRAIVSERFSDRPNGEMTGATSPGC